MSITVFDVETTGLVPKGLKYQTDFMHFPRVVQLAWWCDGELKNHLIYPDGFVIPESSTKIHGITQEMALEKGLLFVDVIEDFIQDASFSDVIVAHNSYFDVSVIKSEVYRLENNELRNMINVALDKKKRVDTMMKTIKFVNVWQVKNPKLRKFPNLMELHVKLFNEPFSDAHDAGVDVMATLRCYERLVELGLI